MRRTAVLGPDIEQVLEYFDVLLEVHGLAYFGAGLGARTEQRGSEADCQVGSVHLVGVTFHRDVLEMVQQVHQCVLKSLTRA